MEHLLHTALLSRSSLRFIPVRFPLCSIVGVQGFMEYTENHCPSAVVPVDLQKLARKAPQSPLRLLVDVEHRLYGGFYTDWVVQSLEDHHLEVLALCRKGGFRGLVVYDSDYALSNIPYFFSAHALKLNHNSKSLTTSQYLMHEVSQELSLDPKRFIIFASLLEFTDLVTFQIIQQCCRIKGAWPATISVHLCETQLINIVNEGLKEQGWLRGDGGLKLLGASAFSTSVLFSTSQLSQVRAHQLVLPPCDVVIKAVAEYARNIPDITNLEAIAKDILRYTQIRPV
ncbi:hypothetical protein CRENBAI_015086 [Crenichthys baileyi]|uniref:Uncharacterized protein n=1 Tax=Crenichthys baileyi TaxID=28760 RepID=A0AAV9QQR3_9TELE